MKLLLALCLAACAPGYDGVRQSLSNTEKVLSSSAQAFETYDLEHQQAIVKAYQGRGPGGVDMLAQRISQYRAKRQRVLVAFSDARSVLIKANALLPLVETHIKQPSDLKNILLALFSSSDTLRNEIANIWTDTLVLK